MAGEADWYGTERREPAPEARRRGAAERACSDVRERGGGPGNNAFGRPDHAAEKVRGGSWRTRLDAVPVKARRTGRPPRAKGIYHVGLTDYPDPTYP